MEAAGLAVGAVSLAALFTACIDCFEVVQRGRQYGHDYALLETKFNNQRLRLSSWGRACGFNTSSSDPFDHLDADQYHCFASTLTQLLHLLGNGAELKRKYGLRPEPLYTGTSLAAVGQFRSLPSATRQWLTGLRQTLSGLQTNPAATQQQSSLAGRTRWVIRDRAKFEALVRNMKDLIDDLELFFKDRLDLRRLQGEIVREEVDSVTDMDELGNMQDARIGTTDMVADVARLRLTHIVEQPRIEQDQHLHSKQPYVEHSQAEEPQDEQPQAIDHGLGIGPTQASTEDHWSATNFVSMRLSNPDKQRLEAEYKKLRAAFAKLQRKHGTRLVLQSNEAPPDLTTILQEISDNQQEYVTMLSTKMGRAKSRLRTFGQRIGRDSNVLKVLPKDDKYICLFSGALATFIEALEDHRDTSEEIVSTVEDMVDDLEYWQLQLASGSTPRMSTYFVKLYMAYFQFFADVFDYLSASSSSRLSRTLDHTALATFRKRRADIDRIQHRLDRENRYRHADHVSRELRTLKLEMQNYTTSEHELLLRLGQTAAKSLSEAEIDDLLPAALSTSEKPDLHF